jgi:NitT/TauT family transport system ATP-binding protein
LSIELVSISKSYDRQIILKDFSLTLPEKGIVCLQGPSGCGKTTLLRLLAGLETPDSGEIKGMLFAKAEPHGPKIAMVFQEDRLLPSFSARRNIAIVSKAADPDPLMERLGILDAADKPVHALSGGMQRRVALARAMAYDGDIYLLDEPFKGLDPATKKKVMDQFKPLGEKALVIVVTHDAAEAKYLGGCTIELAGPPLHRK